MKLPLQCITRETFEPYGTVLEMLPSGDDRFQVLVTESQEPWRLAVFQYRNHQVAQLEAHPTSMESFEPLSGLSVLVVATPSAPDELQAFLLDKPVCLEKGVWHQTLALTPKAQVKITENLEVLGTIFHDLKQPIGVWVTE